MLYHNDWYAMFNYRFCDSVLTKCLNLSSFSNVHTVIPKASNVTFTQKSNINEISVEEVIEELKKNMIYEY